MGPLVVLYISPSGGPFHSDTNSASPAGILVMQQLLREDYSLIFPLPSIDRYSFIGLLLSELGRRGEKENAQASKQ